MRWEKIFQSPNLETPKKLSLRFKSPVVRRAGRERVLIWHLPPTETWLFYRVNTSPCPIFYRAFIALTFFVYRLKVLRQLPSDILLA